MSEQPAYPRAIDRRRFLLGGAAAVAGPTLLSSCSKRPSEPLSFWQWYAPVTQDDKMLRNQSKWFEELVATWNDSHDQKVRLQFVAAPVYQGGAKLATAFAAGDGPDIFGLK